MKTVHDLNQQELEELRSRYFDQLNECGEEEVLGDITTAEGIDMTNVKDHYEGTFFVDDDFFCNINKDTFECKVVGIDYDADEDEKYDLPTEMTIEVPNDEEDVPSYIGNKISDETGFTVFGFNYDNIDEAKDKHEKLRSILIENGNEEHGDCIIDEISLLFGFPPTTIYYEED